MHIKIVGCGKVERTLAEQLQEKNISLTLIDTVEKNVNNITANIDAIGIAENGTSTNTLMKADTSTADILTTVTASDELNLPCFLIPNGAVRIPRSHDTVKAGDHVIISTTHKGLRNICNILEK